MADAPYRSRQRPVKRERFAEEVASELRELILAGTLPSGSRIDLRSSSRWGDHDLGANARRIRDFFTELDAAVVEAYGQ